MSRTLKENVIAEIDKRVDKRIHKEYDDFSKWSKKTTAMEIARIKENPKKYIMDEFEGELEARYKELEDFQYFSIPSYYVHFLKLIEIAKDMGFEYDSGHNKFTVPDLKEGNKCTHAQQILNTFKQELLREREKSRKRLLDECEQIKNKIARGEFRDTGYHGPIYVETEERVYCRYERNIVCDFFDKFELKFDRSDISYINDSLGIHEWRFLL